MCCRQMERQSEELTKNGRGDHHELRLVFVEAGSMMTVDKMGVSATRLISTLRVVAKRDFCRLSAERSRRERDEPGLSMHHNITF